MPPKTNKKYLEEPLGEGLNSTNGFAPHLTGIITIIHHNDEGFVTGVIVMFLVFLFSCHCFAW